jgi:DNA repair protein RAD51
MIMESGIRLLIVDSVAAIVRRDFDEGSIVQRQASLAAQAATLKRLAQDFNVAVLVTNQVVAASQPAHFEFDRNVNNGTIIYLCST